MKDNYDKFLADIKLVMPFCEVTIYKHMQTIMIEFIDYRGLKRAYIANIESPEDPSHMNYHFRKACRYVMSKRTSEESSRI